MAQNASPEPGSMEQIVFDAGSELHFQFDTAEGGPIRPRPIIDLFACIMELKLRMREGKPGWRERRYHWRELLGRVQTESDELEAALIQLWEHPVTQDVLNVWFEAADVANQALICADTAAPLPVLQPIDSRGRALPASTEAG